MTKKQVPYWKTHPSVCGNAWMFHSMEFLVLLTCTYTEEINFTSTSVLCLSDIEQDILWILEFSKLSQSCKFLCLLESMRLFHAKKKKHFNWKEIATYTKSWDTCWREILIQNLRLCLTKLQLQNTYRFINLISL